MRARQAPARVADAEIIGRLDVQFHGHKNARASTRELRLRVKIRRPFKRSCARGEAPRNRFAWLRARGVERRTMRDREKRRLEIFGKEWIDNHWNSAPSPAGLGRVRYRLLYSLFRLQRHLLVEGTGASER